MKLARFTKLGIKSCPGGFRSLECVVGVCEGEVDSGDCMASHGLSVP